MGIYSQIKDQIGARDVAEHYGYKVNKNGMMVCPFHPDKNPSLKVDQNFYCFGCQEKGDVIAFAAKLFDLTPFEAAQKLISDMNLTVNMDQKGSAGTKTVERPKPRHGDKQFYEKAYNRILRVLCDYFQLLNN